MADAHANSAKVLFVTSNDFGELSSALYFAAGQSFQATVALPPRAYPIHRESLGPLALPYRGLADLLSMIDANRPDAVLLFSGYLFGVGNILTVEALETLLNELRRRRCRLLTSDPFLGLLAHPSATLFSNDHPKKSWLVEHFSRVSQMLRGAVHLYPAEVRTEPSHPGRSFFNPHVIIREPERSELVNRLGCLIRLRPDCKRWTFILSMEDYGLQVGRHGHQAFEELLISRLRQTMRAGRQPILVAPKMCIDRLSSFAQVEDSILLPFCPYDLFRTISLEAEYVFYWNIFSNSVLARVANGLPVILFDRGHIAHALPPLHRLGIATYYGTAPLPFFPQSQELAPPALARLAAEQKQPLAARIAQFRKLPKPAEVIESILAT